MAQNLPETEATRKGDGFTGRVFSSASGTEVVLLELAAGKALATHTTKVDVIFYALEGTAMISVGDAEIPARAGSILDSPKGIPHGMRNTGTGPFRVLVIKLPA